MEFSGHSVRAIADLLNTEEAESDSDEDMKVKVDIPESSVAALGPGDVGPQKQTSQAAQATAKEKKATKDIWDPDEIAEGAEFETLNDPRLQPEYEIVYKQAVTSEDMFLQMGNKTPLTSSCEDMVVKIHLPDTQMADVTLDVKAKFLDCRTSKYKLGLHLPHPVDHKNGKAQWNAKTQSLHVTLRMSRDLDLFNF